LIEEIKGEGGADNAEPIDEDEGDEEDESEPQVEEVQKPFFALTHKKNY
jgi:hypothetical protein